VPVAVVTGASSGIGAAIARRLARDGWRCVLLARREDRLRELAQELGGEYELCDVTEREQVERTAAALLSRHPQVNLLVNNAGIPGRRDFLSVEPELVERVVRTNYLGGLWCLRAFLPGLEAAAPEAHVVNIVSVAGTVAFPPSGPYSASKHAQLAFSRATSAQLRRRGIHVLTVMPGFIETEGFPQKTALRSAFLRRMVRTPEELADRVVDAVAHRRSELTYPSFYRAFALAQAMAPSLLARFAARSCGGYRSTADRSGDSPGTVP
jgi:NAD(P)-dependent dehydrogenase (short-subunit alcohol dehydrogenase family)